MQHIHLENPDSYILASDEMWNFDVFLRSENMMIANCWCEHELEHEPHGKKKALTMERWLGSPVVSHVVT